MICLYPTKENPTSWRLQYKSLIVQVYFPFKKYDSRDAALLVAQERANALEQRKIAQKLRSELDYNRIFDELGNVKGLGFKGLGKKDLLARMQVTVNGKQIGTTRRLCNRDLIDAFKELAYWRMAKLNISPDYDIKRQLKVSFRLFEQAYQHRLQNELD
ncbi:hypothetical protein ACEZRY_004697 [Vibrio vulnificus]|nr:hypothetical protein [Vibrio vulnificus]ELW4243107.1 hypothetical protein [Vibrio vulnificus]